LALPYKRKKEIDEKKHQGRGESKVGQVQGEE